MLFRSSLIAALFLGDATAKTINKANGSIRANSEMGRKLMASARRVEDNGNANADDISWMVNYEIKFDSCHAMTQYGGEGGGEESNLYTQRIVKYSLCPAGECSSNCAKGGSYIVGMTEFVQAYTQYVQESKEQTCQAVMENCNCEDANDDEVCEQECYDAAGLSDCYVAEGQEGFEVDRYVDCAEIESGEAQNYNNGGNYNYNYRKENGKCPNNQNNRANYYNENGELQFFVGMYCDSEKGGRGKNIYLGSFLDESCSNFAPEITYECMNGGIALPYSASTGESVVKDDCISCQEVDENADADADGGDPNVIQLCEENYEMAGKCESGMEGPYYPSEFDCDFINSVKTRFSTSKSSSGGSAVAWAWFFAVCALVVAGFAYSLYRKLQRKNVSLAA